MLPRLSCVLLLVLASCATFAGRVQRPNIIYIMADDLGWGDLGCYGQQALATPRIDAMARDGMRFLDHYSGHTVCRPSRLVLWTGKHSGHTALQSNQYYRFQGEEQTVVELLQAAGYATAGCGKWALGRQGTTGHPNKNGFDDWFGYLDQGDAHNYYPTHLWHNETRIELAGNVVKGDKGRDRFWSTERVTYSHDEIVDWMLGWIRSHRDEPFVMHAHLTIPHANNERGWAEGDGMEVPGRDELPMPDEWTGPERGFAAMIARMDRDVGRILDLLDQLGIAQNTLVIFTSDNGPHSEGGHDHRHFDSNGPFRGMKRDLFEGGVRVPFIARWPGAIPAGSVSEHVSGFQDYLPTACELAGVPAPAGIDGISYLPTLRGVGEQAQHELLYWRFKELEALRRGSWKLHRKQPAAQPQLYHLPSDPGEERDVSELYPLIAADLTARMNEILAEGQSGSGQ